MKEIAGNWVLLNGAPGQKNQHQKKAIWVSDFDHAHLKYQVIILNEQPGKVLWCKDFQRWKKTNLEKVFRDVIIMSNFVKLFWIIEV